MTLATNTTLRILDLSENRIEDEGDISLKANTSLRILDGDLSTKKDVLNLIIPKTYKKIIWQFD